MTIFYRLFAGNGRGLSLERVYPAAALFLGVLYMLVLPPLSAPDEISHYVSAYQLSSRMLGAPSNDQYGYVLVNAKAFFSAAELEKLYKMARYRKLCLLLLEPRAGTILPGEQIRLFDEDLCELTLDSGP